MSRRKLRPKLLSKAQIQAARILATFRSRKSERQSFVMVGLDGKRLAKGSKRKGLMVYVTGKGKVRPVKEYRKPVVPRREASYDLTGQRQKIAKAKYFKGRGFSHSTAEKRLKPGRKESKGVNWLRGSKAIAKDLREFISGHRSKGQYVIDLSVTVRLPGGKLETYTDRIGFSETEKQFLGKGDYEKFIRTKVWRHIAQLLGANELVSQGSAAHIRGLAANEGLSPDEWLTRRGEDWGKAEFTRVKIMAMSYEIKRIKR